MYGREYLETIEARDRDATLRAEARAVLDPLRPEVRAKVAEILDTERRQSDLQRQCEAMLRSNQARAFGDLNQMVSPLDCDWRARRDAMLAPPLVVHRHHGTSDTTPPGWFGRLLNGF